MTRSISRKAAAYLFLTYASQFGFIAADRTGLGDNPDAIFLNHTVRLAVVLIVSFLLFLDIIFNKSIKFKIGNSFIILIILYLYFILVLVISRWGIFELTTIYRIYEWFLILFLITVAFQADNDGLERATAFCKYLVIYTLIIVCVYSLFFPESILTFGSARFQLGGTAIHPNRLSIICCIGILLFGLFDISRYKLFIILILTVVIILTYSRVGIFIGGICITIVFSKYLSNYLKIALYILMATAMLIALLSYFRQIELGAFSNEGLAGHFYTLNSRTAIWEISLALFQQAPIFGWGFIEGPRQIGGLLDQPWWMASNAQNDLLSAMVAGGGIALACMLALCFGTARMIARVRSEKYPHLKLFLSGSALAYLLSAGFEPVFVHHVVQSSVLFLVILRILDISHLVSQSDARARELVRTRGAAGNRV